METFVQFQPRRHSSNQIRAMLEKYEQNKIIEVYFARLDDRLPDTIAGAEADLYSMDLEDMKDYLLNQKPANPILQQLLNAGF